MGEYVRYKGEEVKIGTMESMYYTSYQKYVLAFEAGYLSTAPGNTDPAEYLKIRAESRFRFPFPDEDSLHFGIIKEPFDRGIAVRVNPDNVPFLEGTSQGADGTYELMIIQQKMVNRLSDGKQCLTLVLHDKATGETFRIEEDTEILALVREVRKKLYRCGG